MNEGHVGHLKILQQSKSCIYEDFNFCYENVCNFCCSNWNWEQIGEVARPYFVLGRYFLVEEVQGQSYDDRVNDETPGTAKGGGSLPDVHQHGGDVELFSSEDSSSFKEVG